MTSFTDKLAVFTTWPIDHPRASAGITLLLAALIACAVPRTNIDFSIEQLYPQDSEMAAVYNEHKSAYGADDSAFFVAREGDPWAPELAEAERRIRAIEGVRTTVSPFTMETMVDNEGVLEMRPIEPRDESPLTRGTVLALDGSAGSVIVRIHDEHNHHQGRDALLTAVDDALSSLDGEWHLAGMPVIRTAYVRLVLRDLMVLLPLALLVSGVFFVMSFRDARQVALGLFSITLGMLTAGAAYVLAGGVLNTFSPAFFAVIIVVGTSDLIHLVHRFSDHINAIDGPPSTEDVQYAARAAAREIGFSCLLTTATTSVGFLALTWTDLPTIQQFGMGAGMGVVLTYLTTFLVVPPVLARMRPPTEAARRHASDGGARIQRFGEWVVERRRAMLWGFLAVAIGLVALGSKTSVAYRILADLSGSNAGISQQFMEDHMGAVLPMSVDIRFDGDARDPESIKAIHGLTQWLRSEPLIGHATGLSDLAIPAWETLSGRPGTMPDSRDATAQALFLLRMAKDDPVPHVMLEDGQRTRVVMRVKDEGGTAMVELGDRIQQEADRWLSPAGGTATITGVAHVIQWINRTLTIQFAGSFVIALLLIGASWMLITRSPRRVFIALVPNVLPLLAVLGALGALGVPLKPTTAMVFSIGLGIAVDDTIHFLAAYERHRKAHPEAGSAGAVGHAYATAGRSMFDTSLVLVAGLLTLGASEFSGFLYLGGFTAWAVVAALITDLMLLGPLLVALDKR
jgi:hypothetical protein